MVRLLEKKRKQQGSTLAAFAVASFGLHLLTLFLLITQGLSIRRLNLQKPPTFVQLVDGKPVTLTDDLEREPETIRKFVSQTMTSIFDWSGKLPLQTIEQAASPKSDMGISVRSSEGYNKKVATSSWLASFALSEDFRKGFLSQIAEITPQEAFSDDPNKAISGQLVIKRVYPPEEIAPGRWRVGLVADLVQKKRAQDQKVVVPFNKDVLVRAVDTFSYPLSNTTTDLQKAVYGVRSSQMEIYEIRNLCLLNGYEKSTEGGVDSCRNM